MKISSDTSDKEEEWNVTSTKKRKLHSEQKYSHLWEKNQMFSGWVKKSTRGDYYFYCESCKCDSKCEGGKRVLEKHAESAKHKSNVKGIVRKPTITSMLPESATNSFTDKNNSGKIKMTCFLATHNLPFSLADDLKDLVQSVIPDSKLASELTFGKTKAHAIVTNVTGKVAETQLTKILQQNKFSLIVDESTDRSSTKHLALIVRTAVDVHVEDSFLCLIPVVDGMATSLHSACTRFFEEKNIPYKENMVGTDGTNSMFGQHHSLSTLSTTGLKLYFQSAVLTDRLPAPQSILDKCMEPTTELYLQFLDFVLPYFNDLHKEMQSESQKLYLLYEKIFITYKTILECFLRPEFWN
ncbi:hypothetical protein PV325_003892 [Microctonus aethiopoides]|nr:hypothetical protein PV325_003892 [Microctonus aethiopoides]KAK0088085.1 hypothetical protein PV326_004948 [Microctonus aethiopoides]